MLIALGLGVAVFISAIGEVHQLTRSRGLAYQVKAKHGSKPAAQPVVAKDMAPIVNPHPAPPQDDLEERKRDAFASLSSLVEELRRFKSDANFHEFGFGITSPYRKWLTSMQSLDRSSDLQKVYLRIGVVPGEIIQAGQEYAQSRGAETSYTRFVMEQYEAAKRRFK